MRVFLVRHGESQGNVDPLVHARMADHAIPLSDRGREQAREAGRRLASILEALHPGGERPPVRLWTSPYRRTRETASGVEEGAAGFGQVLPHQPGRAACFAGWILDRREHILLCEQQFGLFDGIPDDELAQRFPNEWAHYDKQVRFEGKFWARMPLGESRFDVATRVHQAFGTFQRDLTRHGFDHLVVICHGVTLRAFVMMWCHLSPEWFEAEPNPHNAAVRLIDEGEDKGYVFEGFPRVAADANAPSPSP